VHFRCGCLDCTRSSGSFTLFTLHCRVARLDFFRSKFAKSGPFQSRLD